MATNVSNIGQHKNTNTNTKPVNKNTTKRSSSNKRGSIWRKR